MKLYNSIGMNPQAVRVFIAEKGLTIPLAAIDLPGMENRREPYLSKVNPAGQSPALELDDGSAITEVTAICEYLEDLHPKPALIGGNAKEKAEARMWIRRLDLNILEPMANGFRYGDAADFFRPRMRIIPQAADDLKKLAQEQLAWLDGLMAGRQWVCGNRFTLADIMLTCWVNLFKDRGQPLNPANRNVNAIIERTAARPSMKA